MNVLDEHLLRDARHSERRPVWWCENDGREGLRVGAGSDHVIARGGGCVLSHLDDRLVTWHHESVILGLIELERHLVEKDDVICTYDLDLAMQLSDAVTRGRSH